MRRCLLILALCLLAAPAAASAQDRVSVELSSQPDSVLAGEPWKVRLTILQPGRAPRADLRPAVLVKDADGFTTTYPARPAKKAGRYTAVVTFPRAGQFTYAIRDGITARPPEFRSVLIRDAPPVVDRPDPVGPPELPIVVAALIALGSGAYFLAKRHRGPTLNP